MVLESKIGAIIGILIKHCNHYYLYLIGFSVRYKAVPVIKTIGLRIIGPVIRPVHLKLVIRPISY